MGEGSARGQGDIETRVRLGEFRCNLHPGVAAADDQQPPAALGDVGQAFGQRERRRMIQPVREFLYTRHAICANRTPERIEQIVVTGGLDARLCLHRYLPLRRFQRGDRALQETNPGPAQKGTQRVLGHRLPGSQLMIAHPLTETVGDVHEGDGDGLVRFLRQAHGGHQPGVAAAQHEDVCSLTHGCTSRR